MTKTGRFSFGHEAFLCAWAQSPHRKAKFFGACHVTKWNRREVVSSKMLTCLFVEKKKTHLLLDKRAVCAMEAAAPGSSYL